MIQMKKNLIVTILLFAVVTGFYSCTTKTVNDFNDFVAGLGTGAYMKGKAFFNPANNSWTDQSILGNTLDAANLSTARIGVKIRQWGDPVSYINIYTVRNTDGNQANWKFIKKIDIVDTNYFDVYVTAQEIATALNLQLNANAGNFAPGSIFTCYVEVVTTSGKKFTANNSNFTSSGANFYYPVFSFRGSVVCPYNPAVMAGDYVVVTDDWADWSPGDVLPNIVSATTATSLSLLNVFPNPAFGGNSPKPILVNITVASGVATVTNQEYGNYGTTPIAVTTQGSGNFIYSCTGTITMLLRHHVPGALNLSYGNYQLTLKKQ
jgi:hypothetical protein